jgi:AcrR family transcriptional regulator
MVKQRSKRPHRKPASAKARGSAMQLLWAPAPTPTRGPKPALSLQSVIDAALGVVDREGMAALTMARVAEELDVTTMATYRYVPSKEELIDLMIDAAFAHLHTGGAGDWRADISRWARAELAMFRARPWMIETVLKRVAIGPNWLAWLDAAFAALASTPLRTSEKFAAITVIDGHVRAAAQIAAGAVGEWQSNFSQVLASTVSDPRYPALGRALVESSREPPRDDAALMAEQFEFGLERILDGIQTFLEARSTEHRGRTSSKRRRNSSR